MEKLVQTDLNMKVWWQVFELAKKSVIIRSWTAFFRFY